MLGYEGDACGEDRVVSRGGDIEVLALSGSGSEVRDSRS